MKRNWLFFILICSVGLNLGMVASFAYWRYGSQPGVNLKYTASPLSFRELTSPLNLTPEQLQIIRGLLPEHQRRIGDLRLGLTQRRQELLAMLQAKDPSWSDMQDKIREISELQGKLEMETVQFFLGFQNSLKPEQKIALMMFMEHRLLAGRGGKGRRHGPWGPRGRSGPKARGMD
ncbi:MAG: periplasmic heavy metal sensor [Deltaproteobacteria bacterium]|nr:MAG: periplasmic heavy metal sensor [Deltaproteobacteria bacterium]